MKPPEPWLEVADRLGARLVREAFLDGTGACTGENARATWLGDSLEAEGGGWRVAHRATGPDLYAGTAGIGLFLAHLAAATGEPLFARRARQALRQALSRCAHFEPQVRGSFYSGPAGLAWALHHAGRALADDELAAAAHGLWAELVPGWVAAPAPEIDVIAGAAGLVPRLLELAPAYPDLPFTEAAVRAGEVLLAAARQEGEVWSWPTLPPQWPGMPHLTGFAHGSSGVAWACAELLAVTGDTRFRQALAGALAYERACFVPNAGNWPDFRTPPEPGKPPACAVAWCHGAAGIARARRRIVELGAGADFEQVEQEAAVAAATTEHHTRALLAASTTPATLGTDFTLCHGLAGNALCCGGEAPAAVARFGLERYHDQGPGTIWPCGVPGGGETPGLMTGLAGIGWFYLSLTLASPPSPL